MRHHNYVNTNPKLFDITMNSIRLTLSNSLTWLDNAYWISQKLLQTIDGKETSFPSIHIGKNEYVSMLPDDEHGNYMFFDVDDPQLYDDTVKTKHHITTKFSIIFWLDLSSIYADIEIGRIENIKDDILDVLNKPGILSNGRLTVTKIHTRPENVFAKYSIKQVDSQYFLLPYAAIRFECETKCLTLC